MVALLLWMFADRLAALGCFGVQTLTRLKSGAQSLSEVGLPLVNVPVL